MAGGQIGGGKSGKGRELIHQITDEIDMIDDHTRTFVKDRIINLVGIFAFKPLGRQGDRCQRVFHFVRDAAGDLTPGSHALGLLQLRQVIKNHDYAHVMSGIVFQCVEIHQEASWAPMYVESDGEFDGITFGGVEFLQYFSRQLEIVSL